MPRAPRAGAGAKRAAQHTDGAAPKPKRSRTAVASAEDVELPQEAEEEVAEEELSDYDYWHTCKSRRTHANIMHTSCPSPPVVSSPRGYHPLFPGF